MLLLVVGINQANDVMTACQNLMLAARGLGIGSTITRIGEPNEAKVHDLLGIPPRSRPGRASCSGTPKATLATRARKPLSAARLPGSLRRAWSVDVHILTLPPPGRRGRWGCGSGLPLVNPSPPEAWSAPSSATLCRTSPPGSVRAMGSAFMSSHNGIRAYFAKDMTSCDENDKSGILAHVDAGKTSLTERLLYAAGVIDAIGSVDHGDTQTDSLALERQRGITIKAAVVSFPINDVTVNLIDTPGHPDFIAEVERVLSILDGAVLVISAVEGVQAQTRVLMRTLQRLKIPTLIFVNKIDRAGAGTTACCATSPSD